MAIDVDVKYDEGKSKWDVSISGELDYSNTDGLKSLLYKKIDENCQDVEVDLSELSYIDSSGLGVMVGVLKKLRLCDKKLTIVKPRENVAKIFKITGLNKIINMEV